MDLKISQENKIYLEQALHRFGVLPLHFVRKRCKICSSQDHIPEMIFTTFLKWSNGNRKGTANSSSLHKETLRNYKLILQCRDAVHSSRRRLCPSFPTRGKFAASRPLRNFLLITLSKCVVGTMISAVNLWIAIPVHDIVYYTYRKSIIIIVMMRANKSNSSWASVKDDWSYRRTVGR